jgi:hypothetical protein
LDAKPLVPTKNFINDLSSPSQVLLRPLFLVSELTAITTSPRPLFANRLPSKGRLLGDCWHGFDAIAVASEGRIVRAGCNAHARRYFEKSESYPEDRRAVHVGSGESAVIVMLRQACPALMLLALHIRPSCFTPGVQRIELLLQALRRRLAGAVFGRNTTPSVSQRQRLEDQHTVRRAAQLSNQLDPFARLDMVQHG